MIFQASCEEAASCDGNTAKPSTTSEEQKPNLKRKAKPNQRKRKKMKTMNEEQQNQSDPSNQSQPQFETQDHNYTKPDEMINNYEAKIEALKKQFQKEKLEMKDAFDKQKRQLRAENNLLKKSLDKIEIDLKSLKDSTTDKKHIDGIVKDRLKDHFSEAQLDLILDKTRVYSKKWTNKDFAFAMLVKMISPKVLRLLRKSKILPLPSNSTLKKKFAFLYVTPGYIHSSLGYLADLVPRLKPGEELACLSFDEMKLMQRAEWDQKIDAVIGPHKQAQTFMVRSLTGKWKLPVYVDFDMPVISKSLLLQIIFQLESIGIKIMITTCDQAGGNQALAKSLGIFADKKTCEELGVEQENVTFTNPWDSERDVFFSYDWVHAFKNLRNHMLDDTMTLQKGVNINRADLLKLRGKTEVRGAFKLEDIHFYCKNQDRQSVSVARALLSNRSAMLIKALYPDDEKMKHLSEFIVVVDECFKILTSQKLYDEDPYKCALEVHLKKQLASLEKLVKYMKEIKWSGRPRFNKGIRIAIKCAIGLQETIKAKFNIPNLMTENHTQDFLEAFFGVIRAMMAANNNPTAAMFLQRCKYYITQMMLEDENFDIFSLKEKLEEMRDLSDMDEDIIENTPVVNEELPELISLKENNDDEKQSDDDEDIDRDEELIDDFVAHRIDKLVNKDDVKDPSYEIGLNWIAGSIASKFRDDESLGTTEMKMAMPKDFLHAVSTMFTNSLCKGGLLTPTEEWLADVKKMDQLFMSHHPKGRLRKGTGVTADFIKKLQENFEHRDLKILSFFCRLRTRIRIREMNAKHLAPKLGTLRGRRKQAETIY